MSSSTALPYRGPPPRRRASRRWRARRPPRGAGGEVGLGLERARELRRPLLAGGLVDGQGTVAGVAVLVEGVLAGDALEARGRPDGLDDVRPGRLNALGVG